LLRFARNDERRHIDSTPIQKVAAKVAAMSMFGFPLLLIPLALVNIIAFLMPTVSLGAPLYTVPLTSGVNWTITFSDALIAFSILLMLFEAAKTVRPNGKYLTDHLLSFIVFGGAAAEFVMLPQFGTSTFFLLTVLAFVDFVSGIWLRLRLRRMFGARARAAQAQAQVEPQRTEPTMPSGRGRAPASDARQDPVLELDHPLEARPAAHDDPASANAPNAVDAHREEQRG
jgi:hypothetical protein